MSGFNNRPGNIADNVVNNISGIFSTKPTARYASGARTILKINGKICGFAFGISWRISTQHIEITTIDDWLPHELAPQRVSVEGSISALHIPGQSAGTELWQADALNFLFGQYIEIEVRDDKTDQLMFYTSKAMITSRSEDIRVDQLASVQLTWRAIGYQDERSPKVVDGYNKTEKESEKGNSRNTLEKVADSLRKPFGN